MQRIAIIGAGPGGLISGSLLARRCVLAGFETVLEDLHRGKLRQAMAAIENSSDAVAGPTLRYSNSIEDAVRDADLVIDTVPDELESKLEILSLLDRMAPPAALFATPTSQLSIADLASCTYRPTQCFGLRFNPATEMLTTVHIAHVPGCPVPTLDVVSGFFRALGLSVQLDPDLQPLP